MAIVKAPLLSLGASGKLAGTLVASTWKGIKTMREYVKPANPKTAAQVTQRGLFTDAVSAYRNYFTNATGRADWDRTALASGKAESGFNSSMRALLGTLGSDPDASFSNVAAAAAGNTVDFTMLNADDGAAGDEAGDFEIWVGSAPDSLLLQPAGVAIDEGTISTADLGDAADVKYVKIRKTSFDRSGIAKITLTA